MQIISIEGNSLVDLYQGIVDEQRALISAVHVLFSVIF